MEMYHNVHKLAVQAQFEQQQKSHITSVHDAKVSIQSNPHAVFAKDSNHIRYTDMYNIHPSH